MPLVGVRPQHDLYVEFTLQERFEIIEVDGAFGCLHCQLHAGPEMERIKRAAETPGHFVEQFDPRQGQSRAIATVRHGHQFDFVVSGKLSVSLGHSLVAFGARYAGMILDAFAVEYGYSGHGNLHSVFPFLGPWVSGLDFNKYDAPWQGSSAYMGRNQHTPLSGAADYALDRRNVQPHSRLPKG